MRKSSHKPNHSNSKSSKSVVSMITRKNPEVETSPKHLPYFYPDPIRDTIEARVKEEKQNFEQKMRSSRNEDHLGKADAIIKDLFQRHQNAKQKLKKMKEQTQKQYNQLHPFRPNKVKNERYPIEGDVVKRNQVWLREKKKKHLEMKEEATLKDLKECTFSPKFSSKKRSELYLQQRQRSESRSNSKLKSMQYNSKTSQKFKTRKRDYTEEEYQQAKKSIISRMMGSLRE